MRPLIVLTILLAVAPDLSAQSGHPRRFRVLLPLHTEQPVPGALGSLWETSFTIHNPTEVSHYIKTCVTVPPVNACTLDLVSDEELKAGETQKGLPTRHARPPLGGVVMTIDREGNESTDGKEIALNLRVRDLSRNASSAGTELPVVREGSFRTTTPLHLLAVPTEVSFRPLLRLYEMNLEGSSFAIRTYDEATGARLSERVVTLQGFLQNSTRPRPAYSQFSDIIPPGLPLGTTVRIEVAPLTPRTAFWAFVSLTNNVTQELTLITPP